MRNLCLGLPALPVSQRGQCSLAPATTRHFHNRFFCCLKLLAVSTGCSAPRRGPHIVRSSRQMSDNWNCLSPRVQAACGRVRYQGKRCLFSPETYHSPVKPGTEHSWWNNLNSLLSHLPCVHFNTHFYMIPAPFWGEHSQRPMNSTIGFQLHLAFCSEACIQSFIS